MPAKPVAPGKAAPSKPASSAPAAKQASGSLIFPLTTANMTTSAWLAWAILNKGGQLGPKIHFPAERTLDLKG